MLSLTLLIFAYTIGIGTVILSLISYCKGYNSRELFIFHLLFLLLIVTLTLDQLFGSLWETLSLISLNLLGIAIPFAIMSYREGVFAVPQRVITAGSVLSMTLLISPLGEYPTYLFFSASLVYAMLFINRKRSRSTLSIPQIVLRRVIPLLTVVLLPAIFLFDVFEYGSDQLTGFLLLPLFYIVLNLLFLTDSIKQLTQRSTLSTETVVSNLPLSVREQEVVLLLLKGFSYARIASELSISQSTVKSHCSNIYFKLNIENRYQLFDILLSSQNA